jgi:hypothetical protein
MATKQGATELEDMKIKQIVTLLVGITSVALSPVTRGQNRTVVMGSGGGGHPGGGGIRGAPHFSGGPVHFGGGTPRFSGRPGTLPMRPPFFSGPDHRTINRPAPSNIARNGGAMPSAVRPSRISPQRGLNGRTDHIAERHEANWHGDWDHRHAHFHNGRFFVYDDGFWYGLDDGFFPWDYLPYYADDYYPYDYYADIQPTDNTAPVVNSAPAPDPTVEAAQTELNQLGYYGGAADGIFGPATRDALARYQIAKQLNVTGSLSPDTLQSLGLPQATAS